MMVFVWLCVVVTAMTPGGEQLARTYVNAVEDQYRAMTETRNAIADEIAEMRNAAARAA